MEGNFWTEKVKASGTINKSSAASHGPLHTHSQALSHPPKTPGTSHCSPALTAKPQPHIAQRLAHPHTLTVSLLLSPSMAPCVAPLLAFSLLLLWTSPALGGANDAEDCCLSVTQRPIPGNIVRAFHYLHLKDGCRVPAVVFTTLKGHQLCAPPDQPWVERIIRRLQKTSAKSKSHRT